MPVLLNCLKHFNNNCYLQGSVRCKHSLDPVSAIHAYSCKCYKGFEDLVHALVASHSQKPVWERAPGEKKLLVFLVLEAASYTPRGTQPLFQTHSPTCNATGHGFHKSASNRCSRISKITLLRHFKFHSKDISNHEPICTYTTRAEPSTPLKPTEWIT